MMLAAFETLLERRPPAWVRRLEVGVLMGAFARAFDVEPPATASLAAFREFTAACMEAASSDWETEARLRERLGEGAFRLGSQVRAALAVRPSQALRVTRFLYRGLGIELSGELPGALEFGPCYFAGRYTPCDCRFMSAFDEGFMRGITGCGDGTLAFACRLTEGACRCRARFDGQGATLGATSSDGGAPGRGAALAGGEEASL